MSNMSYCRFENTVSDLGDCQMALEDLLDGEIRPLGEIELRKAAELITICTSIVSLAREHSGLSVEEFFDKIDCDPCPIRTFLGHAQECAKV